MPRYTNRPCSSSFSLAGALALALVAAILLVTLLVLPQVIDSLMASSQDRVERSLTPDSEVRP